MTKFTCAVILLLAVLFTSPVATISSELRPQGKPFINTVPTVSYKQRGSYTVNGQKQTVLLDQFWGAIVYIPEQMGKLNIRNAFNDIEIGSEAGLVKITRSLNTIVITYPGGELKIEERDDGGTIKCGERSYTVKIASMNEMTAELPGDSVTYKTGMDQLTISGKRGEVVYKKEPGGFTVKSNAGTSTYKASLDGGFTLEGVSLDKHPYDEWGVEFLLPKYKVGVIIEYDQLIGFPSIPRQLMQHKALIVNF
jgi:hypothetical protein